MDLLWKPLLASSAKTITGAIGGFVSSKILAKMTERRTFVGAMDFWVRGIHNNTIQEGDTVFFDGLISPYAQLFPGDPLNNTKKWNQLYEFEGLIDSAELQMMDFYAGVDAALRIGAVNGETLVGLYDRFGYIGDGILGVVPTKLLQNKVPNFFRPGYWGQRAIVGGKLSRCPSQHGFIVNSVAQKAGIELLENKYLNLWYLQIQSIYPYKRAKDKIATLLGSSWAVTENKDEQYLVQYGYFQNQTEREMCLKRLTEFEAWDLAAVFFDDANCPSDNLSFKKKFIA